MRTEQATYDPLIDALCRVADPNIALADKPGDLLVVFWSLVEGIRFSAISDSVNDLIASRSTDASSAPVGARVRVPPMGEPFVPPSFDVPTGYAWSDFHLEPLGVPHNERDHAAWMSSIDHIRATPGFSAREEPGWPVPKSLEANRADLVRHAKHFDERRGFTYSILDGDDVIGCIYIYPDERPEHDAWVSSWVRESRAAMDSEVRQALATWIDEAWPFTSTYYAGIE